MTAFLALSSGRLLWTGEDGVKVACACVLGRSGVVAAGDKREGDGGTPLGVWPLRRVLYRSDRGSPPETGLATRAIAADDGWCDAPGDAAYNRPVSLPYPASAERMWREDALYDVLVVLGHNDDPPVPPLGSAIFVHVMREDGGPTEGCVALAITDLRAMLRAAGEGSTLEVREG